MKSTLLTPDIHKAHSKILSQLTNIAEEMIYYENKHLLPTTQLNENFKLSATNLIHYLVLRKTEIRELQEYLHHIGLSSLTNSESHTLSQLIAVIKWFNPDYETKRPAPCDYDTAEDLHLQHAEQLLGYFPDHDRPHIMVTFSKEMAVDRILIEDMLNEGMTIARINCAHDNHDIWLQMVTTLKKAIAKTGKSCKLYMDLAGPKIRIRQINSWSKINCLKLLISEEMELMLTGTEMPAGGFNAIKRKKLNVIQVEPFEILKMIKTGEHVFFDDGKFEARVQDVNENYAIVKITRISTKKPYLKPEKGINLPDSELQIQPLTETDKDNIPFICKYADLIGYSFVTQPSDLDLLYDELNKTDCRQKPFIILKIERLNAVQNLPALLLHGMQNEAFGVMIARGDLAVEIGFERLSEIQEEILWLCEAAHVPVIWATQVLESLNKTGILRGRKLPMLQ